MTTRADVRARVRDELNDNGSVKLWADGLLDRWIGDAIRAWSQDARRERTYSTTSTAGDGAYALPADVLEVLRVEHPAGCYRQRGRLVGGDVDPDTLLTVDPGVRPVSWLWDVWAGELVLSPAPGASGEPIVVRYHASYTVPADDVTALDVASADESALVWWTCAQALQWIGTDEAKRQRFERQRGADPAALRRTYEGDYQRLVRARTGGLRQRRAVVRE